MTRGRLRLISFIRKPRNPTEEGIGEALRIAFGTETGDESEVRRMEQLIERMKDIEGIGD